MYIVREVMQCKPGKVKEMVGKFKALNTVIQKHGFKPFRIMTDVSGEPFWTVVLMSETETIDGIAAMEAKVMADEEAGKAMAGYHDLVTKGRREIYKAEN